MTWLWINASLAGTYAYARGYSYITANRDYAFIFHFTDLFE